MDIFLNQKRCELSSDFYGVFYEEINHAGDGGLYGELVRNRNFMDARLPEHTAWYHGRAVTERGHTELWPMDDLLPGWKLHVTGHAKGEMCGTTRLPRNERVPNQLELTARHTDCGEVTVYNSGYWGMSVQPGNYRLTMFVRGTIPSVRAFVETPYGEIAAQVEITGIGESFSKIEAILTVTRRANGCRLGLTALADGILCFDFVSLFPCDTFCGRENGMKPHIAQMIADLSPSFFRFPGGCIVEGINLDNAFSFTDTLGPVEDRPGKYNLWGYRRTDGIGYHEYLTFCEDIGAKAMYVVNCGISCQARHAEYGTKEQTEAFLQEAIHAIEYAIGNPKTSEWAARRADAGHPAPFPLAYVEIGNENQGEEYLARYRMFVDVLKQRFPSLTYIMNDHGVSYAEQPVEYDLVDEHFYETPERFLMMTSRYDRYPRDGKGVYVGEYAANQDAGRGNMAAACAEAAFLMHMEENSDVVKMASYAPLLCHMNDRKWPVNLICFEDDCVFGTPSYHVQKLFSSNRPQTMIRTSVLVDSFTGETQVCGNAGMTKDGEIVIKVVNFSKEQTKISINVPDGYEPKLLSAVTADTPETENSIEEPQRVENRMLSAAASFVMQPYGVYVLICGRNSIS